MSNLNKLFLKPSKNGCKWGFVDITKKMVIDFKYDYAEEFNDGLAKVGLTNDGLPIEEGDWDFAFGSRSLNYGFIDIEGKEIIPVIYNSTRNFNNGFVATYLNNKWGFIDKSGQIVIPFIYDDAKKIQEGLAVVKKNNKWGYVDVEGNRCIDFAYDDAWEFIDGLAKIQIEDKFGIINFLGVNKIPCKYFSLGNFVEDFSIVAVYRDGGSKQYGRIKYEYKYGFVNKYGWSTSLCIYDEVENFKNGIAKVRLDKKWGLIDKNGEVIVSCIYDKIDDFNEDLAKVKYNTGLYQDLDKFGFIDKEGKETIPLIYDEVDSFHEGLAGVKMEHLWGYIDSNGKLIIPFKFDKITPFSEGLAIVCRIWRDKKIGEVKRWYIIDKKGNELITCESVYKRANRFIDGRAEVISTNGLIGEIDINGVEYWSNQISQFDVIYKNRNDDYLDLKREYFDAMTDGQLGSYDNFEGDFDDIDLWSGG